MKEIGIYIHIPFCMQKCLYCDFCSFDQQLNKIPVYVKALSKEIHQLKQTIKNCAIKSIFIGGGTPSILSLDQLDGIINALHKNFHIKENIEFSIESNPGTLSDEKLKYYKNSGINRLSMGLQAWQDELLKKLGRIHDRRQFIDNYQLARKVGFENINVDLMFGLPNQTLDQWEETLENLIDLDPEHISAYSLKIEEHTPFFEQYEKNKIQLPTEEMDRKMYHHTLDKLSKNDYKHYEISNFSKKGRECIHNKIYWNNKEYIGLGLGAHSYFEHVRFNNTTNLIDYIDCMETGRDPKISEEEINQRERISETMFLGLRMMKGVNIQEFINNFNVSPLKLYETEIKDLIQLNLIKVDENTIQLTRKGIDLSNQVFMAFLLD